MNNKQKIKDFIIETFLFGSNDNSLGDEDSFLETGIIDSTGVLELVSFVEEEFEIEVRDEELVPENFDSLNKLAEYVGRKSGVAQ